jgi:adenylate cyclase
MWGDTVNIAARMESNSEVGKINISQTTYDLVKDNYEAEYRGEIEAKNRGMLKMYFLEPLKQTSTVQSVTVDVDNEVSNNS